MSEIFLTEAEMPSHQIISQTTQALTPVSYNKQYSRTPISMNQRAKLLKIKRYEGMLDC